MNKGKFHIDSIVTMLKAFYICGTAALTAAAFSYMLSVIWGFEIRPAAVLFVSAFVSATIHFIMKNKNGLLFLLFPIIIFTVICIYAHFNVFAAIISIFNQVWAYWKGNSDYSAFNAYIITLLTAVLITGAVYFIQKKYITRFIMAVLIFIAVIAAAVFSHDIPKFTAFSAILYIFMIIIEAVIRHNKNNKRDNKYSENSALFLFPAAFLSVLLAVSVPSSSSPINWSFLNVLYTAACENVEIAITELKYIFNKDLMLFSVTGYSDQDKDSFGGKISDSESVILNVNAIQKPIGNLYLTGTVKNYYDGKKWTSNYKNSTDYNEYTIDYLEFCYGLYNNDIVPQDVVYKLSTAVTYQKIRTKTLFYPIKSIQINTDFPQKTDFSNTGIIFNRARGSNTAYSLSYLDIDYTSEAFQNMIKQVEYSENYNKKDFSAYLTSNMSYLPFKGLNGLLDNFQIVINEREEKIYDSFLKIPDSIPDRVYELANEITIGCDTDYEKLKAIENYLSSNYTYTKSPKKTPGGREALDYFLFDSKQGYCTYFATAMAVLARAENIPTRYVEGVVADFKTSVSTNTYSVTENNSHAWTEAYIKGIGWIPFEPTASYYTKRYASRPKPVAAAANDFDISQYLPDDLNTPNEMTLPEQETDLETEEHAKVPLIIILVLISVLISAVLYYRIIKYRYHHKFEKADSKQQYIYYFSEVLFFYSVMGFSINSSETINQFAERIADSADKNFKAAAKTYTKLRYSSAIPQKSDFHIVSVLIYDSEKNILAKKGHLKMLLYRIKLYNS